MECSGLGASRDHLHRRDLQVGREIDLRQRRFACESIAAVHASLDGKVRRAIDFVELAQFDEVALTALIREPVRFNKSSRGGKSRPAT